mmetsp:Transcript_42601/g.103041  ORF Transcript_42601/g.103041 Transcript_42601/m.103041 type:complete len:315 (-) Transcript_42601:1974-2918(-)
MGTDYIQAGACVAPDDEFNVTCALEASQCPSGHSYISNRQLQDGAVLNAVAKACLSLEKTEDVKVGRCINRQVDDFICTSHKSACALSTQFNPLDEDCDLRYDLTQDRDTFYTRCWFDEDLNFCVWDMEECTGGPLRFSWVTPAAHYQNCRCDEVRTGACYHEGTDTYTCAVSALGCDSDSKYVRWQELYFSNSTSHIGCQLCKDPKLSSTRPPTPVVAPTVPPAAFTDRTSTTAPLDLSTLKSGELPAVIVISTLLVALILACCIGRQRRGTFSSTGMEFDENDEIGEDEEEHNENEILDEGEFELGKDKEIT